LRLGIESVLAQDYENMEIVIADDASTDNTQEMLREYDKKYPGLFKLILNEKNLGRTANSNAVFHACTGKYIAWLDGDDLFLPGKIKKQVRFLESHPECAICYHDMEYFESETGKVIGHSFSGSKQSVPYEGGAEKIAQYGTFFGNCSAMTRRESCPESGYDSRLPIVSDFLFWFETAINGRICFIPDVLARYRRHEKQITQNLNREYSLTSNLIILGIIEGKYPHMSRYTRRYRSYQIYSQAVQKVLRHQGKEARELFWESLRQGWVSWKWFGWYLKSWRV
ncbi:MAG: glycosyltransferase, partial [Desulfobacterales bacterium]